MKLLVFGATGQLGRELIRCGGNISVEALGRDKADFTDPEGCAALVRNTDADAVINAAAYTAVDKAEAEEDLALLINGTTPTALAKAAAGRGVPFVQVSTDYVFDGAGTAPFPPDHATGPLGAYGRTKLAGEAGVIAAGGPHAIIRTSWVVSSHGHNFVKTMLRLGKERDRLTIVADQIGGPTPAAELAGACVGAARALLANPDEKTGIYHCSGGPDVSWADFAREIFDQAGIDCDVEDIPSSAYPTPAKRPLNSRLDCTTLTTDLGVPRPDWKAGLHSILEDLGELGT